MNYRTGKLNLMQAGSQHQKSPLPIRTRSMLYPLPHTLLSDALTQTEGWSGRQDYQLGRMIIVCHACKPSTTRFTFHLSLLSLSVQFLWQHLVPQRRQIADSFSSLQLCLTLPAAPPPPPPHPNTHSLGGQQ